MSVFGINKGIITQSTKPNPKSNYGKSKLLADIEIEKIADEPFKVAILRPPIVYRNGCKGNYQRLKKLALKTPLNGLWIWIYLQWGNIMLLKLRDFPKRLCMNVWKKYKKIVFTRMSVNYE